MSYANKYKLILMFVFIILYTRFWSCHVTSLSQPPDQGLSSDLAGSSKDKHNHSTFLLHVKNIENTSVKDDIVLTNYCSYFYS